MRVNQEQLEYCLEKVGEVVDFYNGYIASDDPKRSVNYLHDICERHLGLTVRRLELEIPERGSAVKAAFILTKTGAYDICVARNLNHCWSRFVFCKELFHVVMDREESRNMDIPKHVEAFTVPFPGGEDNAPEPTIAVQSEFLAEIAAMEFLFPYRRRVEELNGPNKTDSMAIAEKYKVPLVYVEKYTSKPFMDALGQFCG